MALWIGISLIFYNAAVPPALGVVQAVVKPAERALASANIFLSANLLGLGLGPLLSGMVSDWLRPQYGSLSLNYAVCCFTIVLVFAGFAFLWAAHHLKGFQSDPNASVHH